MGEGARKMAGACFFVCKECVSEQRKKHCFASIFPVGVFWQDNAYNLRERAGAHSLNQKGKDVCYILWFE